MSSTPENSDLRVKRTRKALATALLSLVQEKNFDSISVGDITQKAIVNRATFYLHYRDKYELLEQIMKEMHEDMAQRANYFATDFEALSPDVPPSVMVEYLNHIAANSAFYRVMLSKDGVAAFSDQLRIYLEEFLQFWLKSTASKGNRLSVPVDIAGRFMATAYVGVISWWLEHHRTYSAQQIAAALWKLTVNGPLVLITIEPGEDSKPKSAS